jgi:signal peptidase I
MMTDDRLPAETPQQAVRDRARRRVVSAWVRDLILSVTISAFFIIFLYQPVRVEGTSMLPVLEDQERIFINKFVYRWEPIARGDIVVFRFPRDTSKSYIKRVIGMPGDHIVIDKGRVYLNGQLLQEEYVPAQYVDFRSYPEIVVPPGSYFVLGDHRSMSSDSREFGPVESENITGKAVLIYWPFEKAGLLR